MRARPLLFQVLAVTGFVAAITWLAVPVRSQESDGANRVRGLSGQALQVHAQLQGGAGARAGSLRSQLEALLQDRGATLAALAESNPAEALRLAWPADLVADIAAGVPAARAQLESRGVWQGPIEYIVEDGPDFRSHRNIRAMSAGGETLYVQFAGSEPPGLRNGDTLRVEGVRIGSQLVAESGSIVASNNGASARPPKPTPPPCSTVGDQSTIVLLVTMPGVDPPIDVTPSLLQETFFHIRDVNNPEDTLLSLTDYWKENSYGLTTASGTIAIGPNDGWYTLNQVYNEDQTSQVRTAAIAAADADVDFSEYRRIFIIVNGLTPGAGTSSWAGRGTLGCGSTSSADGSFNASTSWIKSPSMNQNIRGTFLAAHEGGHNLSLNHSNSRDFDLEVLGAPGLAGVVDEYNDVFSSMGRHLGHYATAHKAKIGWLLPSQVQSVTGSGSYSVQPTEMSGATVQALRIRRGTDDTAWLWVEYRQPVGLYDSRLVSPFTFGNQLVYLNDSESHIYSGAIIHYEDATTGGQTHLLDFTPQSRTGNTSPLISDDWFDPALAGTWQDPYTGLSITTSNPTATSLTVSVSYGSGPCIEANPTVTLSPSNPSTKRGQTVTFTVTVTNNDSVSCSGRTFVLASTLPPGWLSSFSSSELTVAAGQSASASMTKTVPSNAAYATYAVNATATSGSSSGTATGNVTVKPGK